MKILYVDIADLLQHIPNTLQKMGHEVDQLKGFTFGADYDTGRLTELLSELFSKAKRTKQYDFVISFNYFYIISEVAKEYGICYISWIYDSPQAELFHPSLANENNAVFVFDRMLLQRLREYRSMANLFFLPLAGNTAQLSDVIITEEDEKQFGRDIAFVGGMYENNVYNQTVETMEPEQKEWLADYLMGRLCHWDAPRYWPSLREDMVKFYQNRSQRGAYLAYEMPQDLYYGCMILSRKLCEMERLTILNRLSERHPVSIYTNSKSPHLDTVRGNILPPVDYRSDMLKVFHLSRINLNMTLPSIETGVPLRVFDIMSAGGFCLTNWQEELEEVFEVGKEIEVYRDLDELYAKTEFYLRNEDARIRIAVSGYQAIRDRHDYGNRLQDMLDKSERIRKEIGV